MSGDASYGHRLEDAERRIHELSARLDEAQTALVLARRDCRLVEERLSFAALHDVLTSLPNRRALLALLAATLARPRTPRSRVAVLFVHVDGCTVVNDGLGLPVGDELVSGAAARVVDAIAEHGTVTHFGTDQFVAVIEGVTSVAQLRVLAERIVAAFAAPLVAQLIQTHCTISIGIDCCGTECGTAEQLVRNADMAMLQAKAAGRNCIRFFSPAMRERVSENVALEADLRRALESDELFLNYQPIVAPNGRIIAFETLVRWHHPQRGIVSPERFIPLAEESGMIVGLGLWILRRACCDFHLITRRFSGARLAVNISSRQLQEPGFETAVRRILIETEMDPSRLELEMTESVLMADVGAVLPVLERLRALGVRISLDDFGTGYSSLAYLKALPVDTLKIDQSFVRDISDDELDGAIAHAIVALAHSLGLRVVAEGVETQTQRAYLEHLGCDELQGFLFSPPISPVMVMALPSLPLHESSLRARSDADAASPVTQEEHRYARGA
jgi:diguanylate cyclase (GGDEF)-like protein